MGRRRTDWDNICYWPNLDAPTNFPELKLQAIWASERGAGIRHLIRKGTHPKTKSWITSTLQQAKKKSYMVLKSEEEEAAVHILTHNFQTGICPVCRPSMEVPRISVHPKLPLLLWQRDHCVPPLHFRGSLALPVRGALLCWGFWFAF